MKTNKTIKWLLAVGLVAVIAGCDGSGSGKSGSNDGSAAGLDMLDLTTVDQEALAKQIHNELTNFTEGCSAVTYISTNKYSAKKYEEDLVSGPCAYGGSINVIENVEYEMEADGKAGWHLEVSYDQCKKHSPDGSAINGYRKKKTIITIEGNVAGFRRVSVLKNGLDGMENYICTADSFKGESLEVTTKGYTGVYDKYYKYSVESKILKRNEGAIEADEVLYNINGYKTYAGGFVHVKADAIIEKRGHKGCRTDGVVHLTGKNNSKVTIQYNADRSMDFTLNGKTEHWYSCMQKNP